MISYLSQSLLVERAERVLGFAIILRQILACLQRLSDKGLLDLFVSGCELDLEWLGSPVRSAPAKRQYQRSFTASDSGKKTYVNLKMSTGTSSPVFGSNSG